MRSSKQSCVMMPAAVLALLLALTGVSSLPGQVATPGDRVPVIISFQNTPGATEQALVRAFGGEIKYSYTIVPAIAASVPQAALNGLRNHPLVTVVEDDVEITAYEDPEYSSVWGVTQIRAPEAYASGVTGAGVKVAVIDSGVDCRHPELSLACAAGDKGWDFVASDGFPDDENGHGTHVAGTIAADYGDASGVAGVAPDAGIVPLRVLNASGSGSFSSVIAALQWIQTFNGAHGTDPIQVTNNSYGSSRDPGTAVRAAFDAIAGSVLHVAAAGNATALTCRKVGYPAAYDSVVAVGATDDTDSWAYFSCYGAGLELSAPGVDIVSTYLGNRYAVASGTSMASPHVAGAAALVFDANLPGTITPSEVRQRLQDTSLDVGTIGWDQYTGYGRVDAFEASRTGSVTDVPPTVSIISPANGANVSGTVTISASASDDNGVDSVQFLVDGSPIDTDTNGYDGWSATWNTAGYSDGSYEITAIARDTIAQTGTSGAVTVTVNNTVEPPSGTMHIGDLDGSTKGNKNNWSTTVVVTVHDGSHSPVSNATVTGSWSAGTTSTCTTDASGQCALTSPRLSSNETPSVTFSVTSVTHASLDYNSGDNHDPDGPPEASDGTTITVYKP